MEPNAKSLLVALPPLPERLHEHRRGAERCRTCQGPVYLEWRPPELRR